tara:strand:+ start:370 stop:1053 length:684 start_codon:yes stop_codon:yes gene_type:complete
MIKELQKRILTSLIILPLSFFFIIKGGNFLLFFLFVVFFIATYELVCFFKKKETILFLDIILVIALFSIYQLRTINVYSYLFLIWIIILVILSDIGGYIFGRIFNWKKLSKISPNKTLSGVLGSFLLSLFSLFILEICQNFLIDRASLFSNYDVGFTFLKLKYFFLAIILSIVCQFGDLAISYFKRLEKIKDTGNFLPGHGGIFDRIDGLMFVTILTFILFNFNLIP